MYTLTKYPNLVIRDADGAKVLLLSDGNAAAAEYNSWLAYGGIPNAALLPTQQEQFYTIEQAFDHHIDAIASEHGYGRAGLSPSAACIGYADYPNQWQAEAIKFGQWVSTCCALLIQGQQDVISGVRPMPTPEQAIAELPVMVW